MQLKLFPHDLQERLNMSTIQYFSYWDSLVMRHLHTIRLFFIWTSFSGLANTFVLKALQKIAFKSQKATPLEVIQGIAGSCNGDLRSALNTMNWMNTSKYFTS